ALRATRRREPSAPIVAAIRAWAHQQRALPESSFGKAIAYMLGVWPGLTLFLNDPRIALDSHATHRGLRGLVVGRKNHYSRRSQRGTEVAPSSTASSSRPSSAASNRRRTCSTPPTPRPGIPEPSPSRRRS